MNEHQIYSEQIPEHLNGTMGTKERKAFETHLAACNICQAEVEEWKNIAGVVQSQNCSPLPEKDLAVMALNTVQKDAGSSWNLNYALTMMRAQIPLIRSEIWASTFLILMIGIIGAYLFERVSVFSLIAPLVAAGCMSAIYGKDNDDAHELMLSTPVSQMQILLSRLVLVFGYNLILFIVGALLLQPLQGNPMTVSLLGEWLAPMTFLSSLALLLSVSIGAGQAVMATYVLWLSSWFVQNPLMMPALGRIMVPLAQFMEQTGPLYLLSGGLLLVTLFVIRLPLGTQQETPSA